MGTHVCTYLPTRLPLYLAYLPTCLPAYRVYLPFYPTNQPTSLPPLKYQVAVADPLPAATLTTRPVACLQSMRPRAVKDKEKEVKKKDRMDGFVESKG